MDDIVKYNSKKEIEIKEVPDEIVHKLADALLFQSLVNLSKVIKEVDDPRIITQIARVSIEAGKYMNQKNKLTTNDKSIDIDKLWNIGQVKK